MQQWSNFDHNNDILKKLESIKDCDYKKIKQLYDSGWKFNGLSFNVYNFNETYSNTTDEYKSITESIFVMLMHIYIRSSVYSIDTFNMNKEIVKEEIEYMG